jgi:leucyl-tRNA synthetase
MKQYDHTIIEKKWQQEWAEARLFETPDAVEGKENEYVLVEFPYPSGNLHVGHWYAFALTDIYARFQRLQGKNVLFPIGFDAFGLPAENAAIKNKLNPREWTYQNMETMRAQFALMGASFDWSRELATCSPEYYKWTQFLFLQLFKAGLAQKKTTTVNWDPVDKTVLANEQVLPDGTAERSGALVEQKQMEQWTVGITKYADRLLSDLDELNWPEPIKDAQRNWIGKSEGAIVTFDVADHALQIPVYTTRIDTIFSGTFLILAPEHPQIATLKALASNTVDIETYVAQAIRKTERTRLIDEKEKTGVQIAGVFAINPATGAKLQIWIADFVLGHYGTGAVFADAHDKRDFDMAKKYGIPLAVSVLPEDRPELYEQIKNLEVCSESEGLLINSAQFDGLHSKDARPQITSWLEAQGKATPQTQYKLRDWIVSRQRYWGCPIPIINCPSCGAVPVPDEHLPVVLPEIDDYLPRDDGKSPLAKATEWMHVACPACGREAERETDTLDTFVDSSWYFLRYPDARNTEQFADMAKVKEWMPVNFYSGGAEHTTMHLLYARFFNKALFDLGFAPSEEPFTQRLNRGLILGTDGNKMSKSKGNVIDPDTEVAKFGSDTVRSYLAFIGPYNEPGNYPWDPNGIVGVRRFIERIAKITEHITEKTSPAVLQSLHHAIKKVGEDTTRLKFNTAIAQLMTLTNVILKEGISQADARMVAIMLTPFAPHLAEELWQELGGVGFVQGETWPVFDAAVLIADTIQIAIQINGKLRDSVEVAPDITEEDLKALVLGREQVQKWLDGKQPIKVIYVPQKLISIVI